MAQGLATGVGLLVYWGCLPLPKPLGCSFLLMKDRATAKKNFTASSIKIEQYTLTTFSFHQKLSAEKEKMLSWRVLKAQTFFVKVEREA